MSCRRPTPGDRDHIVRNGRHLTSCDDDSCRGCLPCDIPAVRHCSIDADHLDAGTPATCDTCVGQVRRNLLAVVELAALLPDHALAAGHDGRLLAAAPIPGGDALVMMSRGSEGLDDLDAVPDEHPPSFVLAWWRETWAEQLDLDSLPAPWRPGRSPARTIVESFRFLDQHHTWAAQHHPGFWAYARDLHRLRSQLEQLLTAGDDPARGVPCFECDTTLVRDYQPPRRCDCGPRPRPVHHHRDNICCLGCAQIIRWELKHETHDQGGLTDPDPASGWHCPHCGRTYTAGEYQRAVATDYDLVAEWRPEAAASELTGAPRGSIRGWASGPNPKVRKRRDTSGRVTYNLPDIRARLAVREGERRTQGQGAVASEAEQSAQSQPRSQA